MKRSINIGLIGVGVLLLIIGIAVGRGFWFWGLVLGIAAGVFLIVDIRTRKAVEARLAEEREMFDRDSHDRSGTAQDASSGGPVGDKPPSEE